MIFGILIENKPPYHKSFKMKPIIRTFLLLILFSGCQKKDVYYFRQKLLKCDLRSQTPGLVSILTGKGFAKTYYLDGLVKSVRTKRETAFLTIDSLVYTFTYANNKAIVSGYQQFYEGHSDGMGGPVWYSIESPAVYSTFTVQFDPKTFNALSAGNTTFNYDNTGKLISYKDGPDEFAVSYDDKGNITRVNGPFDFATTYDYDYTKTARQQFYYSTGFQTNEMYNLMEIMNWIPVQPTNLRTRHSVLVEDDVSWGDFYYYGHVIQDGVLTSFFETYDPNIRIFPAIENTWNCRNTTRVTK